MWGHGTRGVSRGCGGTEHVVGPRWKAAAVIDPGDLWQEAGVVCMCLGCRGAFWGGTAGILRAY